MSKVYKVAIDPGHGPGSANISPDRTYQEQEFAWAVSVREKAMLERHGVLVVMTRTAESFPSLAERCAVANNAGVDLVVSNHSNAVGAGSWVDTARGLMIYTSAAGATAGRNIAANAIIARMREAGVIVRPYPLLHNAEYTVLVCTNAPSMIVEYGFHTHRGDVELLKSDAYRDLLAEATVKGILDYLGLEWVPDKNQEEDDNMNQDQFDAMQKAYEEEHNPTYLTLADVPSYWRDETQELIAMDAIRGDGEHELNIKHETLRSSIIAYRAASAKAVTA